MKKIVALLLAALMALSLAACGGSSEITITVSNDTSWDGEQLYISPSSESDWGDDLLDGQSLASGASATIALAKVEGMNYDIRMVDADGDYWQYYNVALADGAEVSIASAECTVTVNGETASFEGGLEVQSDSTDTSDTTETSDASQISATLANRSSDSFYSGYVSPVDNANWGSDVFGNSTLTSGDSLEIAFDESSDGTYDIKLTISNDDTVYIWQGVVLTDGDVIIVTDGSGDGYVITSTSGKYNSTSSYDTSQTASGSDAEIETTTINVSNSGETSFSHMYATSSDSTTWGSELLGSDTISGGDSRDVELPDAASIDLMVQLSSNDGGDSLSWYGVDMENVASISISFADSSLATYDADGNGLSVYTTTSTD